MKILAENKMYAVVADSGMAIKFPGGYCHKLYRKENDFSDCTEVDISEVPVEEEELTETEQKARAYDILMGVSE